jgi:hypothetical protein
MWLSYLQGKMNIISASFGLVANAPWNPSSSLANAGKLFKSTQTPQIAQSNRINDIQHTIPLVTKPKLAYI